MNDHVGPARLRQSTSTDRGLLAWSSLTFASRVISRLAQLLFLVAAARLLTLEEFATYSYLLVLAVTFSMFGDTGVSLAASREVSAGRRSPADAFWSALPVVGTGAGLAAVSMLVFGALDSGPSSSFGTVVVAAAFVAANILFAFGLTMLRGVGRFGFEAALQLGSGIAFVVVGVAAAAAGLGLMGVLAVLLAKELISALIAFIGLRTDISGVARARFKGWRSLFRIGIKLAVASTALAIATRGGLIILGNTGTTDEIAWLSAPLRIADAALVFALTAGFSLLPGISNVAASDSLRARRLVSRALLWTGLVAALLAVVGAVGAEPITTLLFGSDFEPAGAPARVLLAGLPAYALLGVAWYALVALDGERSLMLIAAGGALVSLVAGLLAIPPHGDLGAAWVYVGTLALMAAACLVAIRLRLAASARGARTASQPSGAYAQY